MRLHELAHRVVEIMKEFHPEPCWKHGPRTLTDFNPPNRLLKMVLSTISTKNDSTGLMKEVYQHRRYLRAMIFSPTIVL